MKIFLNSSGPPLYFTCWNAHQLVCEELFLDCEQRWAHTRLMPRLAVSELLRMAADGCPRCFERGGGSAGDEKLFFCKFGAVKALQKLLTPRGIRLSPNGMLLCGDFVRACLLPVAWACGDVAASLCEPGQIGVFGDSNSPCFDSSLFSGPSRGRVDSHRCLKMTC